MKKTSLLVAIILLSSSVFARNAGERRKTIQRIENTAIQILDEVRYSPATVSDLKKAQSLLRQANNIILGMNTDFSVKPKLRCVDKDGDNRNPWVYATVDANFNVNKITNVQFRSKSLCERAYSDMQNIMGTFVMCTAKDNDDRDPWSITVVNGDRLNKLNNVTFGTYEKCINTIRTPKIQNGQAVFCTARDNDGRDPWVIAKLNLRSQQIEKGTSTFGTLSACQSIINGSF
jgi:hypothetical protein